MKIGVFKRNGPSHIPEELRNKATHEQQIYISTYRSLYMYIYIYIYIYLTRGAVPASDPAVGYEY